MNFFTKMFLVTDCVFFKNVFIGFIFVCLSNCKYLAIQTLQFWSRSKRRKGRINRLRKGPLFRAQHLRICTLYLLSQCKYSQKVLEPCLLPSRYSTQRFVSGTVIMDVLLSHPQLIVEI